jgi:hypothetical protein
VYTITIRGHFALQGCPYSGLEAIDFRKQAGFPPAPTRMVDLNLQFDSEPIARKYQAYLDCVADLDISRGHDLYDNGKPVDPAILKALIEAPGEFRHEAAKAFIDHLVALRAEKDAEEKAERQAREEADRKRREEYEADKTAKEKAKAEAEAKLREWAEANGSGLLRARIEEDFEWVKLAEHERAEQIACRIAKATGLPRVFENGCTPKSWDLPSVGYKSGEDVSISIEASTTPKLASIEGLRLMRQAIESEGVEAGARLVWVSYEEQDEYGNEDITARDEIEVSIPTLTGAPKDVYFLPVKAQD